MDRPVMRAALIGQCLEHGDNGVVLSGNADIAMYPAKEVGRDYVQLFHPDMADARTS